MIGSVSQQGYRRACFEAGYAGAAERGERADAGLSGSGLVSGVEPHRVGRAAGGVLGLAPE